MSIGYFICLYILEKLIYYFYHCMLYTVFYYIHLCKLYCNYGPRAWKKYLVSCIISYSQSPALHLYHIVEKYILKQINLNEVHFPSGEH